MKVRVEIINPRHWLVLYFYPPRGLKKPVVKSSFEIYDKKTLGVCSNYDEWGGLIKDEWSGLIKELKFSTWEERRSNKKIDFDWEYFIEKRTFSSDFNHNKQGKDFIENFELKSNTLNNK